MQTFDQFTCISLSPLGLSTEIALASVRAGGVAVLDAEFCRRVDTARASLAPLLGLLRPEHHIGLRLTLSQLRDERFVALLDLVAERPHWLVICARQGDPSAELAPRELARPHRRVLLEVTDASGLQRLGSVGGQVDGLLAKGHESGGWVGEESALVLTQRLISAQSLPVYVQGAIGPHAAAACRGAGAAGVVLDDLLLMMPESPLPLSWREQLSGVSGQDAAALGGRGRWLRVLMRPGLEAAQRLRALVAADDSDGLPDAAASLVGWGEPDVLAWPMGQGIGRAAWARQQFKTTGRLVQAIQTRGQASLELGRRLRVLRPGGPLAESHGTEFPIVQGPMTRVSDTAAFADAVARAGGLPMVALALMRGPAVEEVLSATRELLGERPWGIGILGFVPADVREAQLEVALRIKPGFALIAGGRPDQAARLERAGIASYLHVPTPNLARVYLDQGARRFVFEGRECGGHVGPLSSFALWDAMVDTLLEAVPEAVWPELHLLFAGGIHDARSAAMVEALTAPLAERGAKIGVLMGTAYLFTEEAVASGAIGDGFQQQALACTDTVTLETGPGHASRCAVTPFAEEFFATDRRLRAEGRDAAEVSRTLDALSLGRLRVATKGILRRGDELLRVDAQTQLQDGMYMIGQVAALRDRVVSMRDLHASVCPPIDAAAAEDLGEVAVSARAAAPSDVAVVGIATILPKAREPEEFWANIVGQVDAIVEIPPDRWDWRLYYDADPKARDKSYSKWGCVLEDVPFDPGRFGIPPKSLPAIDPIQLLGLEVVRRALDDAGLADGDFDRESTSVIFGYSGGLGQLGERYVARTELFGRIDDPSGASLEGLPEWTEDSFPGLLPNVAAGRVANRFDLGGANFTVDSACASSLTAIDVAVAQLESGRCELAIAGGLDTKLSAFGYLCFSKTPAMSPQDRPHPFDAQADGILLGEGVAAVVLKRLDDAERDGDHIYAVIKAAASSSDGKALGLTAPRTTGQLRAFRRAYDKAGFSPASIGFYEAHGTGTRVGDQTEVRSVTEVLASAGAAADACAVGSVKVLIGHTKSTAGVAALIKATLALYHRTLPAQPGVTDPLPELKDPQSPVYLLTQPQPWLMAGDEPRRAGVSAFGFGGANCHCVVEEYRGRPRLPAAGGTAWPHELVLLSAADRPALADLAMGLHDRLGACASPPALRDIAFSAARGGCRGPMRLALVVDDSRALIEALKLAAEHLRGDRDRPLPPNIRVGEAAPPGKVAFLFPGQGAQYVGMAREAALYWEPMRGALEAADVQLAADLPQRLSRYLMPTGLFGDGAAEAAEQALTATAIAQPALGAVEAGYLQILLALGLRPDMTAGHSFGELVALHAAGVLSLADLLRLARVRGESMAEAGRASGGAMAAINAPRDQVEAVLKGTEVVLANHNAPSQAVISGAAAGVEQILAQLQAAGIRGRRLAVSGAFHSPLVAGSQGRLSQEIAALAMAAPALPVYSNINAEPYAEDGEAVRRQLMGHLLSPVEFLAQIEAMYAAGARWFVEVGPKSVLTGLVGQILADRAHLRVAVDGNGGGLRGLLMALAGLFAEGADLDWMAAYAGREGRRLSLPDLPELEEVRGPAANWLVNGAGVRAVGESRPPHIARRIRPAGAGEQTARVDPHPPAASPGDELTAMSKVPTSASVNAAAGAFAQTPSASGHPLPTSSAALSAYQAYQETMRQFLRLQEQVMARYLGGGAGVGAPVEVGAALPLPSAGMTTAETLPPAPPCAAEAALPPAPAAAEPTLDRQGIVDLLVAVVSDCTGYPPEMLGLEQDLEAELGIDSIKRVEILGGVEKRLPSALAAAMSAHMERFTRVKSLDALAETLLSVAPEPAAVPAPGEERPAAAPAPAALDHQALVAVLVAVVADCTGYPPEMLGPDQDLEAELGIDSIKRVEILGGVEKRLPPALARAMSAQMDRFTRVKSLNGLAETLASVAPASAEPSAPAPARTEAAMPATLDHPALVALFVDVVSDCTGYPPEMLGLDQDLEAELGIDSIKRVEILSGVEKRLPAALARPMSVQMERLTRVRSLNALAATVLEAADTTASAAPSPTESTTDARAQPTAQPAAAQALLDRFVMRAQPVPLPPLREPSALAGLVLIAPDPLGVGEALAKRLGEAGITAALLSDAALEEPQRLGMELDRLRAGGTAVTALVHLSGLAPGALPEDLQTWRRQTRRQVKSLFHLLQSCAADLRGSGGQVLAASLLGGYYGRDGASGPGLPVGAGSAGMLKTIAREWSAVRVRNVDFDDAPADTIAERLFNELLAADEDAEVGYANGVRLVFSPAKEPLDATGPSRVDIDPDWVVLALGGARGITAEAIKELVLPGMRLVLVGRSSVEQAESELTRGIDDTVELRRRLIGEAEGRGTRPTPVEIDRIIGKLRRIREIRSNIQALEGLGATVEYHAADIGDADGFVALLDDVYARHGRIDAVVQGIGIIEDKRLVDKTAASFDRVLDTKVDATYLLCRHLRAQTLKLMVLFASVAGRTGNPGQCDYAAANEVLNRCAWWMRANWPQTRVLSINWGPWAATGMASEEVNRQFRARGVIPIPPDLGRRFLREEIRHGAKEEVELVAGIFDRPIDGVPREGCCVDPGNAPSAIVPVADLPLLDDSPQVHADGSLVLRYTFSLARGPYLDDHRVSGTAVVPAAVAVELMAEVAQAGWPDRVVAEVRDLRVLHGIRLDGDADRAVLVRARAAAHGDAQQARVDVEIVAADEARAHYRCTILLRTRLSAPPADQLLPLDHGGQAVSAEQAYGQYCFHGPTFQLLEAVERITPTGADGWLRPSDPGRWIPGVPASARWIFDPGITDVLLQMVIIHDQLFADKYPLPSRIERIERHGLLPSQGVLRFFARNMGSDQAEVRSDYRVLDAGGGVALVVERLHAAHSKALNRLSPVAA